MHMEKIQQFDSSQFDLIEDIPDENPSMNSQINSLKLNAVQCKNILISNKGKIKAQDLLHFVCDLNFKGSEDHKLRQHKTLIVDINREKELHVDGSLPKNIQDANISALCKPKQRNNISMTLSVTRESSKRFLNPLVLDRNFKSFSKKKKIVHQQLESIPKLNSLHVPPVKLIPFNSSTPKNLSRGCPMKPKQKLFSFGLDQF